MSFLINPYIVRALVSTLVDRAEGTASGDMTDAGGLAAAFDGNTNQSYTVCASRIASGIVTSYVGRTWAVAKRISAVKIYPANDSGGFSSQDCDLSLEVYDGAVWSAVAGTAIGTPANTYAAREWASLSVICLGLRVKYLETALDAGSHRTKCAELQFWEWL